MATTQAHYNGLKHIYNDIPMLSDKDSYFMRLNECIDTLELDLEQDQIVDVGAGTSALGILMKEKHPLAKKMICVEPSDLLPLNNDLINPLNVDAMAFSKLDNLNYNAVVFIQSMHHLVRQGNAKEILKNIYNNLPQNGRVGIIKRPDVSFHIPWFSAAHKTWNDIPAEIYKEALLEAGFKNVDMHNFGVTHKIEKLRWYDLIKSRFFSNLKAFTDEEIENGIEELENGLLKDKDFVEIFDTHIMITGWKEETNNVKRQSLSNGTRLN